MKRKGPRRKHEPPRVIMVKLGRERAHGIAFYKENLIALDERLHGLPKLETLIHEWMHIYDWVIPEQTVDAFARKLAVFLHKHGVRIIEQGDKPLPPQF
jgi:hypothetical protein